MKIKDYLHDTDSKHSDMVDAFAYMVASQYAKLADEYVLLHIKKCPKWLPESIYKWVLSKVLVLDRFK